jgi:hypothetical protein
MFKNIFQLTLAICLTAPAFSHAACELVETGGQRQYSKSNEISGRKALREYQNLSRDTSAKSSTTVDKIGIVRVGTLEKIIDQKRWQTDKPDNCNDYKTATLTRVCTVDVGGTNPVCADLCEQLSYSDDCR